MKRICRSICRMLLGGLVLSPCCPASAADAVPAAISGKVFLDANGNGKFDPGEKGLAGVRVTDGIGFSTTDGEGAYSIKIAEDYMIPYRPARTVSICWPTGKWPTGRWWHRLSEIADARAVHFGLRDDEQKLPFVFVQGSDCHSAARKYTDYYAHDVKRMMPAAKFIFNTGDTGGDSADGARSVAAQAAAFPIPMFVTPGNHDFVGEDGKTPLNQEAAGWGYVTRHLGPVRWSFDYAGVHFLSLEYMEKTEKGMECKIPHVAVQFMEKDLAQVPQGTRVVLLVHCYDASGDFYQALRKFRVDQILNGHTHIPDYVRIGGAPASSCDSEGLAEGIVTADAIDLVGRRSLTRGESYVLGYFKAVTKSAMEKRRQKQHTVTARTINNSALAIHGSPQADSVEIIAEFVPGSARKMGLRIGAKDTIEITFDGKAVNIASAPVPFSLIPEDILVPRLLSAPADAPPRKIAADKSVRWHILIDHDRVSLYANDLFRLTKAIKVDQPAAVTILAEGGDATIKKFDVWELRTISNPASRGLHHFPPPAWKWGGVQLVAACLDDKSKEAGEMLKRYSSDGVTEYGRGP